MTHEHNKNDEQMTDTQVASAARGYDYKRIASTQRLLLVALKLSILHNLIYVGGLLSGEFVAEIRNVIPVLFIECLRLGILLFAIITYFFTIIALFSALRALRVDGCAVLFLLIGALAPVIGLIILFGVHCESIKRFRLAGYQVPIGFFGADIQQFYDQTKKEVLPHSRCGVASFWIALCANVVFCVIFGVIVAMPDVPAWGLILGSITVCSIASCTAFVLGIVGIRQQHTRKVLSEWGILLSFPQVILIFLTINAIQIMFE